MPNTLPISAHLDAASLIARDVPISEVARQFDVSRRTIHAWQKTPEAQAQIAAVKASVKEATKALAVADKVRRINHAQQMLDGVLAIIEDRRRHGAQAHDPLPGEATGHVAVKITETTTGNRDATRTVVTREAAFDAALHAEARKWLEYVAKELGEMETGVRVSGGVDHRHTHEHRLAPDYSGLSLQEQFDLDQMLAKVQRS